MKDVREKQKDNALFKFLDEQDVLHPYYLLLLRAQSEPDILKARPEEAFFQEIPKSLAGGKGLSLLGAYQTQESLELKNMRKVIDVLARYVDEFGEKVEAAIFARVDDNDDRFNFVSPEHELYKYYEHKVKKVELEEPSSSKAQPEPEERRQRAMQLLLAEGFLEAKPEEQTKSFPEEKKKSRWDVK